MHQPLIRSVPIRKQFHEGCSFGSVAVSILLLGIAFVTVLHDAGLHYNKEQSLGNRAGTEEPAVARFGSGEIIADSNHVVNPSSREDISDDIQQSKLFDLEAAANTQERDVGDLEEVPVGPTAKELADQGIYDCHTYKALAKKPIPDDIVKSVEEFLKPFYEWKKTAKDVVEETGDKTVKGYLETVNDQENVAYTDLAEAFSGTNAAAWMQKNAAPSGIGHTQPDENLSVQGIKSLQDEIQDGSSLALLQPAGPSDAAWWHDHMNNHVLTTNAGNIDGLNPVTLVTVVLTAILDQIPSLKDDDMKAFVFGLKMLMKVVGLAVNIAAFGTVWWIAVPLCAISIFFMFMNEKFPENSEHKWWQERTTDKVKPKWESLKKTLSGGMASLKEDMSTFFQDFGISKLVEKLNAKREQILTFIIESAKNMWKKIESALRETVLRAISEAVATVVQGPFLSKAWSNLRTAYSYSACIALVSTGAIYFNNPPVAVKFLNRWESEYVHNYAYWNCHADGAYDITGPKNVLMSENAMSENVFNTCCALPINNNSPEEPVEVRNLDPSNPKHTAVICSMWKPCCEKAGDQSWKTRYYDVLCCYAGQPGDYINTQAEGYYGPATFTGNLLDRYPRMQASRWASQDHTEAKSD